MYWRLRSTRAASSVRASVATWPETATAVAVRLMADSELHVVAPLRLEDLFGRIWRRNSRRVTVAEYRRRLRTKFIPERWPAVTVSDERPAA
jgi:hypothetical protein